MVVGVCEGSEPVEDRVRGQFDARAVAGQGGAEVEPGDDLWVPRTSSTSCDQAVFVDHAADARVSSDTVLLKIDRFG